ncbi:MAG: hypothetical protein ACLVEJ_01775 [Parabacteroides sp.]
MRRNIIATDYVDAKQEERGAIKARTASAALSWCKADDADKCRCLPRFIIKLSKQSQCMSQNMTCMVRQRREPTKQGCL